MARVLKPQGLIVITDWCRDYVRSRVLAFFLRVIRREFIQVLGCEACRQLLQTVGFASIQIERYRIDWLWGLMTATGRVDKCNLPPDGDPERLPGGEQNRVSFRQ
jgi:hypothetical protein